MSATSAAAYLAGEVAYTDILAANGWVCGLSGKWHLGHSQLAQHGFSHWYVHQQGGGPYNDAPMIRDGELITEPGYVTTAITNDALAFIDQHADSDAPFYLGVHYTAPHSPWTGHPQEIVDSYDNCAFDSCPQEAIHPYAVGHPLSENCLGNREMLKGYFAAVTAMDRDIGRILDKLEEKGLREDTLVVFTSDNGFSCGHHGFWGKGNGTYPPNMYENSIKVPFVVSHPGRIPAGSVQKAMVSAYDFMPTLLDYLGLPLPENLDLPGQSALPLLLGADDTGRQEVIIYDEYGGDADDAHRGVEIRPPLSRWAARTLRPSQRPGRTRQSGGRSQPSRANRRPEAAVGGVVRTLRSARSRRSQLRSDRQGTAPASGRPVGRPRDQQEPTFRAGVTTGNGRRARSRHWPVIPDYRQLAPVSRRGSKAWFRATHSAPAQIPTPL